MPRPIILGVLEQDLASIRAVRAILKPVCRHKDGTFGPPLYVRPHQFTIVEDLFGYHIKALREIYDAPTTQWPPTTQPTLPRACRSIPAGGPAVHRQPAAGVYLATGQPGPGAHPGRHPISLRSAEGTR